MSISLIPTEIWHIIFSFATATTLLSRISLVPKLYIDDPEVYYNDTPPMNEHLDTKRAISLVSRSWRAIGLAYLFDLLVVDVRRMAERLSRQDIDFIKLHSPLAHVHQLWVISKPRLRIAAGEEEMKVIRTRLAQLFRLCSNMLECNYIPQVYRLSTFDQCFKYCGASIRCLNIQRLCPPSDFELRLASAAPLLEHLTLLPLYHDSAANTTPPPWIVSFSYLRTLVTSDRSEGKVIWNTPLLECLKVRASQDTVYLPRFHSPPPRLRELSIGSENHVGEFQDVLTDYPNLEALWVECHAFKQLRGWAGRCPSLRMVYVEFAAPHSYHDIYHDPTFEISATEMVELLLRRGMFPTLETVVLCSNHDRYLNFAEAIWEEWVSCFRAVGVLLKYHHPAR